jgi:hypothetical protein
MRIDVQIHIFLTLALAGGEWSGRFSPGTHWIGGWVGPKSRSGRRGEGKILDPTWTQTPTPQSSSRDSTVGIATALSRLVTSTVHGAEAKMRWVLRPFYHLF